MKLMSVIEKQWKLIAGVFVLFVISGIAISLISIQKANKEQMAQSHYFLAEKKYYELKTKSNPPPTESAAKEPKKEVGPADYTSVKADFEKVITDYPGSKAAQMAAVYLSDILIAEKNKSLALSTLQKVETGDTGLINTLVQQQIGLLLADQDKCAEALTVWQKIVDRKQAQFIHNETRIQQALCYKKMNDGKKAEEILTNLANQKPDGTLEASSTSKEAEKYLRLIQFKKASGT